MSGADEILGEAAWSFGGVPWYVALIAVGLIFLLIGWRIKAR